MKIFVICGLLVVAGLMSCAERNITIRSEPPGAKVVIDNQEKGLTPMTFPFTYYGSYQLTLEKDGYQTLKTLLPVKPGLIHIFPIDFLLLVVPYPFNDEYEAFLILEKAKKPDLKKVLKRAELVKEHLEQHLSEEKK
ncbi:MAG: PEGA domain-containing protein [Candidatus Brocadiia bacterium]